LATATFLRWQLGADADFTVLDANPAAGGKVRTQLLAGLPVDTGPDAFLARGADLRALVEGLGLAADIIEPLPGGAFIWSRGRLRPIPAGANFGLPERIWPVLRSGLLSPLGALRAAGDFIRPTTRLPDDPSVGQLVRPRFGHEVYDRMVEPLLGGVHAGSPDVLSAASTVPEIAALARSGRSMALTMRKRRAAAPASPPGAKRPAPLVSLSGGMSRLTSAMVEAIGPGCIRTDSAAISMAREANGCWTVATRHSTHTADTVVLAIPAYAAADLMEPLSPKASALLREIPYVDVANATLAFRASDMPTTLRGTGFLVPPVEKEFIVGCSWLTSKWPHLANDDVVLVKSMVGRWGDDRWTGMDDDAIVAGVRDGLSRIIGINAEPLAQLVQRWPQAMPQYVVGHGTRLEAIDDETAPFDGLILTGSAYRGSGLAACATQARAAAQAIAQREDR
jgi:oxygen-dependent protoporphyrinogen oxidase